MSEQTQQPTEAAPVERFEWHPEYAGSSADQVRQDLAKEIAADQRQHSLAMEGAEESEQAALASVVELERKWGAYDFGWAELDATQLADRIVGFELERERRHEMISWSDYREEHGGGLSDAGELPPADLSTRTKGIALLLVVLLIILILLAVWAL